MPNIFRNLNIHSQRKPVVLGREDALRWIDLSLKPDEIGGVANSALKDDQFAWRKVSTRVNNPRNDGPELLQKI